MITVNSLSGGKTSSYIAMNYPADLNVFSLVCIDNHNGNAQTRFKVDKKIKQMVNDRLQKYSSQWPEFVATSEDPLTLKTIFDLEQMMGREITWLRGMGWEEMIRTKKALPNSAWRFCSFIMKIKPIFEFMYNYHELPCEMRIGYRYDEKERRDTFTQTIELARRCEYRPKSNTWVHRWEDFHWRYGSFPLIDDKILHYQIREYWKNKNIEFPADSNCQNCFWKDPQQIRKNFEVNPSIMYWSAIQEEMMDNTFKKELSMLQMSQLGIQMDFNFGTGAGCTAGECVS